MIKRIFISYPMGLSRRLRVGASRILDVVHENSSGHLNDERVYEMDAKQNSATLKNCS